MRKKKKQTSDIIFKISRQNLATFQLREFVFRSFSLVVDYSLSLWFSLSLSLYIYIYIYIYYSSQLLFSISHSLSLCPGLNLTFTPSQCIYIYIYIRWIYTCYISCVGGIREIALFSWSKHDAGCFPAKVLRKLHG